MTLQAAGDFMPLMVCLRINRQSICAIPVSRKEVETNRVKDGILVFGKAHRIAIQSLVSPAPIQPLVHAETNRKQTSHRSICPGK